jgi:hypothetical protein
MTNNPENIIGSSKDIQPFLMRVNVTEYEHGSLFHNPSGDEKLLMKIGDDLVSLFFIKTPAGEVVTINKAFLQTHNIPAATIARFAEQNIDHHFNNRCTVLSKEMGFQSTLYVIAGDGINDAALLYSKNLWNTLQEDMKDLLFASIPRRNELHFCKLSGNSLIDLMKVTNESYEHAGDKQLSPGIYLFHNNQWQLFNNGMDEIYAYCVKHNLFR